MTSLATVVGLLPMAFKLETGSEAYAPLARVIIGGLVSSIILTIFVVPAAYLLIYRSDVTGESCQFRLKRRINVPPPFTFILSRRRECSPSLRRENTQTFALAHAEKIAIGNHPQIQAAGYLAAAAKAQVTQARSAYYPQAFGSLTGAESGTRQPHCRGSAE